MAELTDLANAQAEIRQRRGGTVTASQWDLPTPCTEWSVSDLVVHLVEGSHMAFQLLEGASADEASTVFGVEHGPDLPAELDCGVWSSRARRVRATGCPRDDRPPPGAGDIPGASCIGIPDRRLPAPQLGRGPGHR